MYVLLASVLVVIVFRMNDQHGVEGITMASNWFDVQRKCKEVRKSPHFTTGIPGGGGWRRIPPLYHPAWMIFMYNSFLPTVQGETDREIAKKET